MEGFDKILGSLIVGLILLFMFSSGIYIGQLEEEYDLIIHTSVATYHVNGLEVINLDKGTKIEFKNKSSVEEYVEVLTKGQRCD